MIGALAATLLAFAPGPAETPSAQAVVRAMFEAFNRHDAAAMAKLYADDARLTSSDFCAPRGKADVVRTYDELFKAHPGVRDDIDTMIVSRDRVSVRFTARDAGGRQPLELKMMTMLRVRDGLIIEDDTMFDTAGAPCRP